jgi:hypothetical protein
MRALPIFFIFFVVLVFSAKAQSDSVQYLSGEPIQDGVFLSYWDFRRMNVISKENIEFKGNKEQLDYLSKALEQEKFKYKIKGSELNINSKEVWGYVQNNTFYVNHQGKFYRIPVFGSISFLVAMVEVKQSGFYDPRFGGFSGGMTTTEQREFIMNFYEGKLTELKQSEVELLLSRDKMLYDEYSKLSNRKQKEQLYRFIRRYNDNNPIYFLRAKEG